MQLIAENAGAGNLRHYFDLVMPLVTNEASAHAECHRRNINPGKDKQKSTDKLVKHCTARLPKGGQDAVALVSSLSAEVYARVMSEGGRHRDVTNLTHVSLVSHASLFVHRRR